MPTRTGGPSRFQRFLGRVVDAVSLGDNYNPQTGQYSNVLPGLIGRGAQIGGTLLGGPIVGQIIKQGGTNYANNRNPFDFTGNDTRAGQLASALLGNRGGSIGPVTRSTFSPGGKVNVDDINLTPSMVIGPLQLGGADSGGKATYGGGNTRTAPPVVVSSTGKRGANRGLPGSAGYRAGGNGAGAGTGYGVTTIPNDYWGDVAAGFGVGIGGASGPSGYAISDAIIQNRKNRV